jgi:hypothetical protein
MLLILPAAVLQDSVSCGSSARLTVDAHFERSDSIATSMPKSVCSIEVLLAIMCWDLFRDEYAHFLVRFEKVRVRDVLT